MQYLWSFPGVSVGKESVCSAGDVGLISGLGRAPKGGYGNKLQYFCLANPTDRGAWQAAVYKVTKSQTQLKQLNMRCIYKLENLICARCQFLPD